MAVSPATAISLIVQGLGVLAGGFGLWFVGRVWNARLEGLGIRKGQR